MRIQLILKTKESIVQDVADEKKCIIITGMKEEAVPVRTHKERSGDGNTCSSVLTHPSLPQTELGLERLLRDSKACWLMTFSNELSRQLLGKTILNGMDSLDLR